VAERVEAILRSSLEVALGEAIGGIRALGRPTGAPPS
jgi:hypothetical protein